MFWCPLRMYERKGSETNLMYMLFSLTYTPTSKFKSRLGTDWIMWPAIDFLISLTLESPLLPAGSACPSGFSLPCLNHQHHSRVKYPESWLPLSCHHWGLCGRDPAPLISGLAGSPFLLFQSSVLSLPLNFWGSLCRVVLLQTDPS